MTTTTNDIENNLCELVNYLEEVIFTIEFFLDDITENKECILKYYNFLKNNKFLFKNKAILVFAMFLNYPKVPIINLDTFTILVSDIINEIKHYFNPKDDYYYSVLSEKLFVNLVDVSVGNHQFTELIYYKKYIDFLLKNFEYYEKKNKQSEEIVRVDKSIINSFFGIMTELLINKDKLFNISSEAQFNDELLVVARNINSIVGRINSFLSVINYVPILSIFKRYPLIVKNLADKLQKKINLVINDNSVVIEKNVGESLGEVLIHLIKNSVDHGVESPEERLKSGKNPVALIQITARQAGNYVFITVEDNGRGLNKEAFLKKAKEKKLFSDEKLNNLTDNEIYQIIFHPGFSTSDKISDVSGRGVGMDAVKNTVEKNGGTIDILTVPNLKTQIIIKIPFRTVIADLLIVNVNSKIIAVTLDYVDNIIYFKPEQIIYNDNNPTHFLYKDNVKVPIWQGPYYTEDFDFSHYKVGIVFAFEGKYLFFPLMKIIEQTQSIIKNYNYFGLTDYEKKYIIGYTIFNEQIVSIIEPDFDFL